MISRSSKNSENQCLETKKLVPCTVISPTRLTKNSEHVYYLIDRACSLILVDMAIHGKVDLVLLPELLQIVSRFRLGECALQTVE